MSWQLKVMRVFLRQIARRALARQPDGVVKLVLTRGPGARGYTPAPDRPATLVCQCSAAPPVPAMPLAVDLLGLRLGHQPVLAHPGIWIKYLAMALAAAGLGQARVPELLARAWLEDGRIEVAGEPEVCRRGYWLVAPSPQWRQKREPASMLCPHLWQFSRRTISPSISPPDRSGSARRACVPAPSHPLPPPRYLPRRSWRDRRERRRCGRDGLGVAGRLRGGRR